MQTIGTLLFAAVALLGAALTIASALIAGRGEDAQSLQRASLLVVIGLSLIAGVACVGIAPPWMLWSGLIAFAVAWCTYLGNLHPSVPDKNT